MNYYAVERSAYLEHYGVKGMKWGVRRYQDRDGTWTEEGKRHRHSNFKTAENDVKAKTKYAKGKGSGQLSTYKSHLISKETIDKYKADNPALRHVRTGKNINGNLYVDDKDKLVAMISVETKPDGSKWIQGLEVFGQNKGKGLSYDLLDTAVDELNATKLSVNKRNTTARHVYDRYGFKEYKSDDTMSYMTIDNQVTNKLKTKKNTISN